MKVHNSSNNDEKARFQAFLASKSNHGANSSATYTGEGANGQAVNKNGDMKGLNSQKEKVNNKFNEIGSHRSVKGGVNRNSQNSLHVQKNVSNCC